MDTMMVYMVLFNPPGADRFALNESDHATLKQNAAKMKSFWLTPSCVLIYHGKGDFDSFQDGVTKGLTEAGKVTFVATGTQIHTTLRGRTGIEFETVFDH